MGSGKTTLGARLAEARAQPFLDLDQEIERHTQRRIRDIIEVDGEAAFRQLELEALDRVLDTDDLVLATGGGIVETPAAHALLRRFDTIVWLQADPDVCVQRLGQSRRQRPLLDDDAVWRRRWDKRQPMYAALAQVRLDTSKADVDTCVQELQRRLSTGH